MCSGGGMKAAREQQRRRRRQQRHQRQRHRLRDGQWQKKKLSTRSKPIFGFKAARMPKSSSNFKELRKNGTGVNLSK